MWNSLSSFFSRSRVGSDLAQAHMTFGQTSLGRSLGRTRLLLKRQLWVWPIIAVVLLAIVGYVINRLIHNTVEESLRSELQTLLTVERSMLEKWFKVQESSALSIANDPEVRALVNQLVAAQSLVEESGPAATPVARESVDELRKKLEKELAPSMSAHDFIGFNVVDKQKTIIAATTKNMVGKAVPHDEGFLSRALAGHPTVSTPIPSIVILKDRLGRERTEVPTMFVCAPVRDDNFQVTSVLAFRIRPEEEFTTILQLGRIGRTGETYAVNKDGVMVSNSRFDDSLIMLGLLPDEEGSASILKVQVRDPGGNITEGFRPAVRRGELPLTKVCAAAIGGTDGIDMQGSRDYRGVPSVAAWAWLPDYQLGVITAVDVEEAYRPLTILRRSFFSMFALLIAGAVAIFVFSVIVARLQRQAQKASIEARQLGQYRLLDKIGAGAMGVVYKGQHAMLRRPTAIKLLDVDRVDEAATQRFEREVQITCKLNNPHTVAIYDYGRTPEGVFYYAMEYLDGVNLQALVDQYGPQPEGRVVSILRQVCSSLYEAHSSGLVHRDIKPANIMLNRRGGEPDVVKVLDFGLVKAVDDDKASKHSDMSGTPLYMSPESIQTPDSVDACSDLYAVGAVGYFLLTGQTAFTGRTLGELCQQHLTAIPDAPSQRLGRAISAELEHAILACLEKSRAKRPQTARDLAAMLDRVASTWTLDDAEAWWSRHERGMAMGSSTTDAFGSASGSQFGSKSAATATQQTARDTRTSAQGLDRTTVFNSPEDEAQ